MSQREPDDIEIALGLVKLGNCTSEDYFITKGHGKVYPSMYGRYSRDCKACELHEHISGTEGQEGTCGNCSYWEPEPSFEFDSYE